MCKRGAKAFLVENWPTKTLTPVGLALDGRVIYGPYDKSGRLWQPCEVDVCNGVFINGEYAYVSTMFHPYTVGCWGPGNTPLLSQSCSSNPRKCMNATFINVFKAAVAFLVLFFATYSL
jgi:hypothetical protein